jgi:N-acetylglucosaminyl-diphospho-decaprenol L-rhamnosyltransferase
MTSTAQIDVSILVVSFNTKALTLAALSSIVRETSDTRFEIIVVDNASSDGSAEAIAAHPAQVKLIALSNNIGFARANNVAAHHARGRYILLLNPDTVVQDRAIDRLVEFADFNPKAMIWGGRTLFENGMLNPSSCWKRMTLWNQICRATGLAALFSKTEFFNGEALGGWRRDAVRHVDIVSGCFLLIGRDTWTTLDGFDPDFFMYGEEADLCLRASRQLGAQPLVTPTATIIHLGGASETARSGKLIKLLAAKATLINRHWFMPTRLLGRIVLAAWPVSRLIVLQIAATLTGSDRLRLNAMVWRTVVSAYRSWFHGYPYGSTESVSRALVPTLGRLA